VVGLDAPAERFAERFGADRDDHEFLDVHVVVGVRATVDDVHQRNRQGVRVRTAEVAEQREAGGDGCGLGDGEADAEDGVRAETLLVVGPVHLDQDGVDDALVTGVELLDGGAEVVDNGVNGLADTLALVAGLVAVAQLERLEGARRCAGRNCRAADRAIRQQDLDLDGRIAAGVKNLACFYYLNESHNYLLCLGVWGLRKTST